MEDNRDEALLRSKGALERTRAARDALRAASEHRKRAEGALLSDDFAFGMLGEHPDVSEHVTDEHQGTRREPKAFLREERAREGRAVEELASATEELRDVTVEPRVEGLKMRFETRKLQATLSAGVLVGAATVTEVLLPADPGHVPILYVAYAAFIVSLSGCISDMNRIAVYVEDLLTGGRTETEEPGWREGVSRAIMYVNQRSLALGLALFVLFATLNLA